MNRYTLLILALSVLLPAPIVWGDDDDDEPRAKRYRATLIEDFDGGDYTISGDCDDNEIEIESDDGGLVEIELEDVRLNGLLVTFSGLQFTLVGFLDGASYNQTFLFDLVNGAVDFHFSLGLPKGSVLEIVTTYVADAFGEIFAVPGVVSNDDDSCRFRSSLVTTLSQPGGYTLEEKGRVEIREDGEIRARGEDVKFGGSEVDGVPGLLRIVIRRNGATEVIEHLFEFDDGEFDEEIELYWDYGDQVEILSVQLEGPIGQVFAVPGVIVREGVAHGAPVARQMSVGLLEDADAGDWTIDELNSRIEFENDETGEVHFLLSGVRNGPTIVDGETATLLLTTRIDGVLSTVILPFTIAGGFATLEFGLGLDPGTRLEPVLWTTQVLDSGGSVFAIPGLVLFDYSQEIEASFVGDSSAALTHFDTARLSIQGELGGDLDLWVEGVRGADGMPVTGPGSLELSGVRNDIPFTASVPLEVLDGVVARTTTLGWSIGDRIRLENIALSTNGETFAVPGLIVNRGFFRRGDANMDGTLAIGDPISMLQYMFLGGSAPCLLAMDTDDDEQVTIGDPLGVLFALFGFGTTTVPLPNTRCGLDQTPGALSCLEPSVPCP